MESSDFFKSYSVLIGFLLGLIGIYIKHWIDKHIDKKQASRKLDALNQLIQCSHPPNWIPTYSKKNLKINYPALHKNTENMAIFSANLQAISSMLDEVSSDIHTHLELAQIMRFNHIKSNVDLLNIELNKNKSDFESIKFRSSEIPKIHDQMNDEELKKIKEALEREQQTQLRFESFIRETELHFLIVKALYENMLKVNLVKDATPLTYNYKLDEN